MSALDQSDLYELIRGSYGGSSLTSPSFTRPYYTKFNSLTKSRDFGTIDNLQVSFSGAIGSQTGASTLFFKVTTKGPSRLGIAKVPINPYTDRFVSVGLVDEHKDPIQLDHRGFAYRNAIHNHDPNIPDERLPEGTYYFTISCDQWQSIPFEAIAVVSRFASFSGIASGTALPRLRFSLVKLAGVLQGANILEGTLRGGRDVKTLGGLAAGASPSILTLTIMSGAAVGSMPAYGRLKETLRVGGVLGGTSPSLATMTVIRRSVYS